MLSHILRGNTFGRAFIWKLDNISTALRKKVEKQNLISVCVFFFNYLCLAKCHKKEMNSGKNWLVYEQNW